MHSSSWWIISVNTKMEEKNVLVWREKLERERESLGGCFLPSQLRLAQQWDELVFTGLLVEAERTGANTRVSLSWSFSERWSAAFKSSPPSYCWWSVEELRFSHSWDGFWSWRNRLERCWWRVKINTHTHSHTQGAHGAPKLCVSGAECRSWHSSIVSDGLQSLQYCWWQSWHKAAAYWNHRVNGCTTRSLQVKLVAVKVQKAKWDQSVLVLCRKESWSVTMWPSLIWDRIGFTSCKFTCFECWTLKQWAQRKVERNLKMSTPLFNQ